MRHTSNGAFCSSCFNQNLELTHIDLEAFWDGPVLDQNNGMKQSIDDLILCEVCIAEAAKLIGYESVDEMKEENKEMGVALETKDEEIVDLHELVSDLEKSLAKFTDEKIQRPARKPRIIEKGLMAEPYKEKVQAEGTLVSCWPLNEPSGEALTFGGSVAPGVASVEGLTRAQPSILPNGEGASCKFDGVKGFFEILNIPALQERADAFSIEFWAKYVVTGTKMDVFAFNGSGQGAAVTFSATTRKFTGTKIGTSDFINATTGFADETVRHYCLTKVAATRKLFINGVEVPSEGVNAECLESTANKTIGRNLVNGEFFGGYLQYLALYTLPISAAKVLAHYNAGFTPTTSGLTIASGFLRNSKGALITTAVGEKWDTGFLREKVGGKLKVTESTTGATWKSGFLRNVEGALIVKEAGAEGVVWKSGHLRDKNGALVVTKSEAETPVAFWGGFLRNKSGRLIIE